MAEFLSTSMPRTGVKNIDDQHRDLVDLLNRAKHEAEQQNHADSVGHLDAFIADLEDHCTVEEVLLSHLEYQHLDRHARGHRDAVSDIRCARQTLNDKSAPHEFQAVIAQFYDVLLNRVLRDDVSLVDHLTNSGI